MWQGITAAVKEVQGRLDCEQSAASSLISDITQLTTSHSSNVTVLVEQGTLLLPARGGGVDDEFHLVSGACSTRAAEGCS